MNLASLGGWPGVSVAGAATVGVAVTVAYVAGVFEPEAPTPAPIAVVEQAADVAQVDSSVYMPEDRGPELEQNRHRLRAGVNWQGKSWGAQYGVTYLSEEFEGQPEGQFLGGVRIKYNF